jgi:2-keto-4-pentenoate hydratase/2-oxohepta-3-ene-1,7-dioic acid hydratase in catechol pathway
MKIARFSVDGWESYGRVEGDRVRVIQGDIFEAHKEDRGLLSPKRGQAAAAHPAHHLLGRETQLRRPHRPSGSGTRRRAHQPRIPGLPAWHKGAHCIIGQDDAVVIPTDSDYVHYEGEFVIVIGKPARKITPEEAPHFIFGYTVGNDISSEGSWHSDISNWRKKGSDTFGPVGPWIETDVDPHNLEIITRLNGREGDRGSTSGMVHNCYAVVSGISKCCTLHSGDIILTGAPGAVEQIKLGDVVEVEIPGIGVLRNPVIAEK